MKAKNFSSVTIELYRIGDVRGSTLTGVYSYNQPAGYVAFGGPGISYPADGADSQVSFPGYTAGVSAGQNAVGFQVSSGSYSAALAEGLTTTGSGLTYLLSNQYGVDSNVATGVGIRLEREGTTLNWLSDANVMTGGNADGWYKLNGTQVATDDVADSYQESFSAILEALPGQTATPGKVYAQAQVFIRVQ